MASDTHSNSAQKNTLGELLVRIGTEGLGNTIKGLNDVSASFLLTKNAAQQAIQPIKQMATQAGNSILELNKVSARTGLPVGELKQMSYWLKLNRVNADSFISQLEDLQQQIEEGKLGENVKRGFQYARISPADLDSKNVINLMEQIRIAYNEVVKEDPALATKFLTDMGLNAKELPFLFKNVKKSIQEDIIDAQQQVITNNDSQLEQIGEMNKAVTKLSVAWESLGEKITAKVAPALIPILDKTTNLLLMLQGKSDEETKKQVLKTNIDADEKMTLNPATWVDYLKNQLPGKKLMLAKGLTKSFYSKLLGMTKQTHEPLEAIKDIPADKSTNQTLPNLPSTTQKNVTVNQTNNVTVNSAKEAYEYVATAEQMEQYEKNNIRANQGVNQ